MFPENLKRKESFSLKKFLTVLIFTIITTCNLSPSFVNPDIVNPNNNPDSTEQTEEESCPRGSSREECFSIK